MPPAIVEAHLQRFASQVGATAEVTDEVRRVTGRPPHTYRERAAEHAAAFSAPPAPAS
jgi:hypothetical protein